MGSALSKAMVEDVHRSKHPRPVPAPHRAEDPRQQAEDLHKAALDLLSRREHSRRELARKLRRRGNSREEIEGVLDRLEEVGLISDERYARLFVRDKLAVNPQGRRRLLLGLRAKGIDNDLARAAIEDVHAERELTERELAETLARKRLGLLKSHEPPVARRRLAGYLARRGFEGRVVSEVVQAVLGTSVAGLDTD